MDLFHIRIKDKIPKSTRYEGENARNLMNYCAPQSFDTKIMPPTIPAPSAATKTAPAAISFAFFTSGWYCGCATSARNSKAVLNASAIHTPVIAKMIMPHSTTDNRSTLPKMTIPTVAMVWIHVLCYVSRSVQSPTKAYLKLRILFMTLNFCSMYPLV